MVRRITIKDIARKAGVSPQTVSRAINDKGEIRPETRARILHIAKQLGYRPNSVARSLVSNPSTTRFITSPEGSLAIRASRIRSTSRFARWTRVRISQSCHARLCGIVDPSLSVSIQLR